MKNRFLIPAIVAAALLACQDQELLSPGSVIQPVFAAAEATPVTFSYSSTVVDPGTVFLTNGVLHIRGQVNQGSTTGDIVGAVTTVADLDIVLKTGKGPIRGTFTIETASGTWEGRFAGVVTDFPPPRPFIYSGPLVGKGVSGDVMGKKLNVRFTNEANPGVSHYVLTGRILDPQGG